MKKSLAGIVFSVLSLFTFGSYNTQFKYDFQLIDEIGKMGKNDLSNPRGYLPYKEELERIKNIKYEKGVYDCRHKSVEYHNYLLEKGEKSYVLTQWNTEKFSISQRYHVTVAVYSNEDKKFHIIDPSIKDSRGFPTKFYDKLRINYINSGLVKIEDLDYPRKKSYKILENIKLRQKMIKELR